jgi:hypothetical protein
MLKILNIWPKQCGAHIYNDVSTALLIKGMKIEIKKPNNGLLTKFFKSLFFFSIWY